MLILHVVALTSALIFVQGKVYLHSVTSSYNPKMASSFDVKVFNDSFGNSLINITTEKIVEVKRSHVYISLKLRSNQDSEDYDITFINRHINTCTKDQSVNIIEKLFSQLIEKYSNVKFHCPRAKGFYYATNIPFDITLIPSHLFGGKGCKWIMIVTIKESESDVKSVRLTQVVTMKIFGETVYRT